MDESPCEEVLLGAWTQGGGVPRTSQPLSTYSLSEVGVMRSSSFRSCHTYPVLYLLNKNQFQLTQTIINKNQLTQR